VLSGNIMKKPTSEHFPIVIKKGFATVKIYRITNRKRKNYVTYTVSYPSPNGRARCDFADLAEAKREANIKARSILGFDAQRLNLSGDDARHYSQACDTIRPTGLPLHSVAHEFARAFDILGGAHIVEAARYYKKHVDVDLKPVTVSEAVDNFHAAKKAEGLSKAYLHDIDVLLGDLADAFQCQLASIQPEDLRDYLNQKRVGLVSKENRRRLLVVLFNYAKAQGWLRKNETTAADALGTYKIKQHEVEIYTPAEMSKLLNAADSDFLPYIALIAFGGVRREELHKGLPWSAVNFERATITVPAAIAKTGRKRKIDMQKNLIEWLAPYSRKAGAIFDRDPRKRIMKVVKASGVKWKRNGLRHSFGSYRMEQTHNEGRVALEMGNSPKVVKDHYFEIVEREAAEKYWSLKPLPQTERKIVAIG
jgi:integrase